MERADSSFHDLAQQWLMKLLNAAERASRGGDPPLGSLVRKFFDFIEANAEEYWTCLSLNWTEHALAELLRGARRRGR